MIKTPDILQQDYPVEHKKDRWEPYTDNEGTCIGFTTPEFCLLAADTRSSDSYLILSREAHKILKLTDSIVLATGGMRADYNTLHKRMKYQIDMYKYNNRKEITLEAAAQLLQNILYGNRFFPIYSFCLLGGIDSTGAPALFSYDAIGSYQKVRSSSVGSGSDLALSIIDSIILRHHRVPPDSNQTTTSSSTSSAPRPRHVGPGEVTVQQGIEYAHQIFAAVSDRDIYTGDALEIYVVTPDGIQKILRPLKMD